MISLAGSFKNVLGCSRICYSCVDIDFVIHGNVFRYSKPYTLVISKCLLIIIAFKFNLLHYPGYNILS